MYVGEGLVAARSSPWILFVWWLSLWGFPRVHIRLCWSFCGIPVPFVFLSPSPNCSTRLSRLSLGLCVYFCHLGGASQRWVMLGSCLWIQADDINIAWGSKEGRLAMSLDLLSIARHISLQIDRDCFGSVVLDLVSFCLSVEVFIFHEYALLNSKCIEYRILYV